MYYDVVGMRGNKVAKKAAKDRWSTYSKRYVHDIINQHAARIPIGDEFSVPTRRHRSGRGDARGLWRA
jgi:hypothetical protein